MVVAGEVEGPGTTHVAHTLGLLILWGIVSDIGVIVGRFCKTWKHY